MPTYLKYKYFFFLISISGRIGSRIREKKNVWILIPARMRQLFQGIGGECDNYLQKRYQNFNFNKNIIIKIKGSSV